MTTRTRTIHRWQLTPASRVCLALVVLAATLTFTGMDGVSSQTTSSPTPTSIDISGVGSWEVTALMTEWAKTTFTSPTPVALTYIGKGDRDGRAQVAKGAYDFGVSGRPPNDDDRAQLAARGVGLIEAPLAITAGVFLMSGPYPSSLRTLTTDPSDPESFTFAPYVGPLRMTTELLAKTIIRRTGPLGNWGDPTFRTDLGLPAGTELAPVTSPAISIARSDPGAANWHLANLARLFAPTAWADSLVEAGVTQDVASESWPLVTANTRSGDSAVADVIGSWRSPGGSGVPLGGTVGVVGLASALNQMQLQVAKAEARKLDPTKDAPTPLWNVQMKNGAGEWIDPSPQAITTAAAAGAAHGSDAMYGLTENVPGAYPFWWTTRIYIPDRGLSIDKTNAMASFVRWSATTGQSATATAGTGALPLPDIQQALAAADRVVAGNCVGPDRRIETVADGGPTWPAGAPVPSGSVTVCVSTGTATTTTTVVPGQPTRTPTSVNSFDGPTGAAPTRTSAFGGLLPSLDGESDTTGDLVAVDGASTDLGDGAALGPAETPSGTSAASSPELLANVAASLPLKPPDDGRGALDRLTTLLLGGVTFLYLRSVLRRRLERSA